MKYPVGHTSRRQTLVIFDGDDTLWRTMPLYVDAKQRFFALLSELVPTGSNIEAEFEERHRSNVLLYVREKISSASPLGAGIIELAFL